MIQFHKKTNAQLFMNIKHCQSSFSFIKIMQLSQICSKLKVDYVRSVCWVCCYALVSHQNQTWIERVSGKNSCPEQVSVDCWLIVSRLSLYSPLTRGQQLPAWQSVYCQLTDVTYCEMYMETHLDKLLAESW